nr:MAG TPA: hypothetical protein [Inoviridae sp.]
MALDFIKGSFALQFLDSAFQHIDFASTFSEFDPCCNQGNSSNDFKNIFQCDFH